MNAGIRRRTPIACLRRFQATLNTNFVRWSKWTDEEDRVLRAAVKVCERMGSQEGSREEGGYFAVYTSRNFLWHWHGAGKAGFRRGVECTFVAPWCCDRPWRSLTGVRL